MSVLQVIFSDISTVLLKMRMNPNEHFEISTSIWLAILVKIGIWFLSSALNVYFYFHFRTYNFAFYRKQFSFPLVCVFIFLTYLSTKFSE